MVRKELFDKCVGLLEESGLGEKLLARSHGCLKMWLRGMISLLSRKNV